MAQRCPTGSTGARIALVERFALLLGTEAAIRPVSIKVHRITRSTYLLIIKQSHATMGTEIADEIIKGDLFKPIEKNVTFFNGIR